MITFYMSEAGHCRRAIAARLLNLPVRPRTKAQETLLKHATRHESLVADALRDEGYQVYGATGPCQYCIDRYNNMRFGIHTEFSVHDKTSYNVVGHIDRQVIHDDLLLPLEIKSLGVNSFEKFKSDGLSYAYKCQEVMYLYSDISKGLYAVCNRDNGELIKLAFGIEVPGFELSDVLNDITVKSILDKFTYIGECVQNNILPPPDENPECFWCEYSDACSPESNPIPEILEFWEKQLTRAIELYSQGKSHESAYKRLDAEAKETVRSYFKISGTSKISLPTATVSMYPGRISYVINILKQHVSAEVLEQAQHQGEPYPVIRLKGEH